MVPLVINPDDFLETATGRVWTPERSREAWQHCFDKLARILKDRPQRQTVVIVCGLQGAGKSTWIAQQPLRADTVYFDAALPGARHRQPIIDAAREAGAVVEVVWVKVPLAVALAQNALRQIDKQAPEAAIRSVAALFEAPTLAEGFARLHVIEAGPEDV